MKAKEFLRQIQKTDRMIENKLIEKEQWKSVALGTTAHIQTAKIGGVVQGLDRVQQSGSQNKMADAVERYIDIETEIDEYIDELVDIKKDVISVIEQLDIVEYDLLHKVYVQGIELYDVTNYYDKSYSWVTMTHGRALNNVQKILDARERNMKEKGIKNK